MPMRFTSLNCRLSVVIAASVGLLATAGSCGREQSSSDAVVDSTAVLRGDSDEMIFADSTELTEFRLRQLNRLLGQYISKHGSPPRTLGDVLPEHLSEGERDSAQKDAWGTLIRLEGTASSQRLLRSAGPDRRWGTEDDIVTAVPGPNLGGA